MHLADPTIDPDVGILIFRASRLEALLEPLELLLQARRPAQVLAPQAIVAAHPGMKHWIVSALARRRGTSGIVANLDVHLVSDWLDDLSQTLLGKQVVSLAPWQRSALRWRIHELLPELDDPTIANYLQRSDGARRRYQLADRLAQLFGQYMIYRPDWLQGWQRGQAAGPPGFQAGLWRRLREAIGVPHRAERLGSLVQRLQQPGDPASAEPLHFFGMSHLAPAELHVLHAVARTRPVALYVPDPCREYWGGLRTERSQLRTMAKLPVDAELQQELLRIDHPLLAQWGRMGQHFILALNQGEESPRVDTRHWGDQLDAPITAWSRLHRVQESVRRLEPADLRDEVLGPQSDARADSSLRIHICHTPVRELEVLRDVLLQALSDIPDLQASDIVVMAPDIGRYAPLLPALFGGDSISDAALPFSLADGTRLRAHSIFSAFENLLSLPESRLTAPQVADLLALPAVARRLELQEPNRQQVLHWMAQSRVAWGLDGAFKQRFDVPPTQEHSFAWAMDRMLAGYVLGGDASEPGRVFDNVLPVPGVHGSAAAGLGALDQLLQLLAEIHRDTLRTETASAWARRIGGWLDQLFDRQGADGDERAAIEEVEALVMNLEWETAQAQVDPELPFAVVREYLRQALSAVPDQPRWLRGGITFCGMVPQRSIPFRVIAVLGLNEGDFPRAPRDPQLDLMQQQRRLGDRDVRDDDRYLFLETLMAARDQLHLSFVGEGVRDGRVRNPAAPLAELMHFLDQAAGNDSLAEPEPPRPWLVRHPLQPFDRRYFDAGDPRLFSFRPGFAAMTRTQAPPHLPANRRDAVNLPNALRVATLKAFFRDPARTICTQWLNLRLDALDDDGLLAREPLEASTEASDRVARRLFFDALLDGDSLPDSAPDWLRLSGMLAAGALGDQAWRKEREAALQLLQSLRDRPDLESNALRRAAQRIDCLLDGVQLSGDLQWVFDSGPVKVVLEAFPGKSGDKPGFRQRLPMFIEWAFLRLHHRHAAQAIRVVAVRPGSASDDGDAFLVALNAVDDHLADAHAEADAAMIDCIHDDIHARLVALLHILRSSLRDGLCYLPKTSAALMEADEVDGPARAQRAWLGDDHVRGERDYEPGYAQWLLRDLDFSVDRERLFAFAQAAALLQRVILLQPMEAEP